MNEQLLAHMENCDVCSKGRADSLHGLCVTGEDLMKGEAEPESDIETTKSKEDIDHELRQAGRDLSRLMRAEAAYIQKRAAGFGQVIEDTIAGIVNEDGMKAAEILNQRVYLVKMNQHEVSHRIDRLIQERKLL